MHSCVICNTGWALSSCLPMRALCSTSVDQSSSELLSSSASDRSAMGNRKMAATPLSWVSSEETVEVKSKGDSTQPGPQADCRSAKSTTVDEELSILDILNWGSHKVREGQGLGQCVISVISLGCSNDTNKFLQQSSNIYRADQTACWPHFTHVSHYRFGTYFSFDGEW